MYSTIKNSTPTNDTYQKELPQGKPDQFPIFALLPLIKLEYSLTRANKWHKIYL